jgi:hypothetical protein
LRVSIETSADKDEWDRIVAGSPDGNIFQSAAWAEFIQSYLGVKSFFFRVEDSKSGETVAILRAGRESPLNRLLFERPLRKLTLPLADRFTANLTWEAGPAFLRRQGKAEALEALFEAVDTLCRDENLVALKDAWPSIYDLDQVQEPGPDWPGNFSTEQKATFLIDLTPDETALWSSLKSSARKCIRRTLEQGLKIKRISSAEELRGYHDFVRRCREDLGLHTTTLRNLTEMWRVLHPAGMLEIFTCLDSGGELMGGLGIWHHAGVLYEWGSIQAPAARERKLYSSDLLKWEVIRWGHSTGCRLYDLAGVVPDPETAESKHRGIYQFKSKWGGRKVYFSSYTKNYKPSRYRLLESGKKLLRTLRGSS